MKFSLLLKDLISDFYLTFVDDFLVMIYRIFRGRLNVFLTILRTKFVETSAVKILKTG